MNRRWRGDKEGKMRREKGKREGKERGKKRGWAVEGRYEKERNRAIYMKNGNRKCKDITGKER